MDLHKECAAIRPWGSCGYQGEVTLASLHLFSVSLSLSVAPFPSPLFFLFVTVHVAVQRGGRVGGNCKFLGHPTPYPCSFSCWHCYRHAHTQVHKYMCLAIPLYPATVVTMPHPTVCHISFWANNHWKSDSKSSWIIITSKSEVPKNLK